MLPPKAPSTQLADVVEVEFGAQYQSTGMGLRVHPATENGIGALFVFSYFASPVQVVSLPPCRYQIDAIGDVNVRSWRFDEIKARVLTCPVFPVVVRFVRNPTFYTLHYLDRPLNIQIAERHPLGRVEIVEYLHPLKTSDSVPNRFCGSHFIHSVNGQTFTNTSTGSAALVDAIRRGALPMELGVEVVQTKESLSAQQLLIEAYRDQPNVSRRSTSTVHTLAAFPTVINASSPPDSIVYPRAPAVSTKRPAKRPRATPALPTKTSDPATKKAKPIENEPTTIVLDDSDDDSPTIDPTPTATVAPVVRSTRSTRADPLGADKVVATPFGIGLILNSPIVAQAPIATSLAWSAVQASSGAATRAAVALPGVFIVQLPYGIGYFQRSALTPIDDKVQCTYFKQRAKGWVVLTYGDTARLVGQRLLNDSVIEFYLSYLIDTLPWHVVERTYMCSSFLFGQYLINKKQAKKGNAASSIEQAYASVARWTKTVDIFQTKYLVVPINEDGHWSVAIVCNLYRFASTSQCRCAVDPMAAKPTVPTNSLLHVSKRPAKPSASARSLLPKRTKVVHVSTKAPTNTLAQATTSGLFIPHPPASRHSDAGGMDAQLVLAANDARTTLADSMPPTQQRITDEPSTELEVHNVAVPAIRQSEAPAPKEAAVARRAPPDTSASCVVTCSMDEEDSCTTKQTLVADASETPEAPTAPKAFTPIPDPALPDRRARCTTCGLERNLDQDENHRPCVVFLDSLKAHRTGRVSYFLREYLQMEWRARKAPTCGVMAFNAANLPAICPPEIPRQANYTDCGVFVLHYVELFLTSPPLVSTAFVATKGADSQNVLTAQWFPPQVIRKKRVAIRCLIERLARDGAAPPLILDTREENR
ncbi:hypothetical protein H310_09517 [Aphanomyces invadans]|uniref:Ubiquitin-like protease family profile domain-containing protein n=1 Tax=Aphanomyces invadans TaxID=157072 RepID=A0A024TW81_9STRA|nr:hypothetical protein H310_09517 [Aphanomyces invadans]ETV97622.1 hypothetical protein H310_09517 [Aphanomyces invadans]|eukprot:XP_008873831.1 hypothetical protein H310_09517 [Aphanomyces invadans]